MTLEMFWIAYFIVGFVFALLARLDSPPEPLFVPITRIMFWPVFAAIGILGMEI